MLIIQIRRFNLVKHGFYEKDSKEVPIPHTLTVKNGESERNKYELASFINHTGTTEGGHYTACCKDSVEKKWYHFDDCRVEQKARLDKIEKGAYILFYKRNVMMQMEKDGYGSRFNFSHSSVGVTELPYLLKAFYYGI